MDSFLNFSFALNGVRYPFLLSRALGWKELHRAWFVLNNYKSMIFNFSKQKVRSDKYNRQIHKYSVMRYNNSEEEQRRCVKLQELIYELSDKAGINHVDAITFTSLLFSSVQEHLLQGHNLNLGELGVLTHHPGNKDRAYEIRYTPSLMLLGDLKENVKYTV